ncbi:unnamed protein product [Trypanosoma congolense IL3000]|uniref:WGS project CAEQ00000000 data, annotated contig 2203 n=1 Tax=Trypanosoma congolense (strain IL3000) TaxID=1068625 RepID=F9WCA2_TRYCI|nr:unnamed protein product [Trypanosoma congolense IL3000]
MLVNYFFVYIFFFRAAGRIGRLDTKTMAGTRSFNVTALVGLLFYILYCIGLSAANYNICAGESNHNRDRYEDCVDAVCDMAEKLGAVPVAAGNLANEATSSALACTLAVKYIEETLTKVTYVADGGKPNGGVAGASATIKKMLTEAQYAANISIKESLRVEALLRKTKRDSKTAKRGLQGTLAYIVRMSCSYSGTPLADEVVEAQCNASEKVLLNCTDKQATAGFDILDRAQRRLFSLITDPNKVTNERVPPNTLWGELLSIVALEMGEIEKSTSIVRAYTKQILQVQNVVEQMASVIGVNVPVPAELRMISKGENIATETVYCVPVTVSILLLLLVASCR